MRVCLVFLLGQSGYLVVSLMKSIPWSGQKPTSYSEYSYRNNLSTDWIHPATTYFLGLLQNNLSTSSYPGKPTLNLLASSGARLVTRTPAPRLLCIQRKRQHELRMASQSPAVTRVSWLALVTNRREFSRESFLSLDNPGTWRRNVINFCRWFGLCGFLNKWTQLL